jgi:hypothetical protein
MSSLSLATFIETADATEMEINVYNYDGPESVITDIVAHLDIDSDNITRRKEQSKPDDYITIQSGSDHELTTNIEALWNSISTTAEMLGNTSSNNPDQSTIIDRIGGVTFTSHDKQRLLTISRHIERRVQQIGDGTLHTCFQRFSRFEADLRTHIYYNILARSGVDVYLYGMPDTELQHVDELTAVGVDNDEIAATWMVTFDGNGTDSDKAALLAQEKAPDDWTGFWTFDPTIVDDVIEYIITKYL